MKRFVILFFVGMLFSVMVSAANISANIDRNQMTENETLTLTVTTDDPNSGAPDLNPLSKDFAIQSVGQANRMSIVNGKTSISKQWVIQLLPNTQGKITIPALTVGNQKTKAISLEVLPSNTQALSTSEKKQIAQQSRQTIDNANVDVKMEVTIDPQAAYVQQQMLYTVKLYTRGAIADGQLIPPQVQHGKMTQFGDDKGYTTVRGGKGYHVIERTYLLFPQQSGEMIIKSPIFKGVTLIADPSRSQGFFDFAQPRTKRVRAAANPVKVQIKPKPAAFGSGWWLPAEKVTLKQTWSKDLKDWKVGDPITRTLELKATGVMGEQLPEMSATDEIGGVKKYSEKPELHSYIEQGKIIGERQEQVTFIPIKSGKLMIPAMKVRWWNTKTKKLEVATVPAQEINILPVAGETINEQPPQPVENPTTTSIQPATVQKDTESQTQSWWRWSTYLFAGLWFLTLWLWLRPKGKIKTGTKSESTESLRVLLKKIKAASQSNDSKATRSALLHWAQHRWAEERMLSLSDVASKIGSDEFNQQISLLTSACYATQNNQWEGRQFWEVFSQSLTHFSDEKPAQHSEMEGYLFDSTQ